MKVIDNGTRVLIDLTYREAELLYVTTSVYQNAGYDTMAPHDPEEQKIVKFAYRLNDKLEEYINT